jgi:hypothetical protein
MYYIQPEPAFRALLTEGGVRVLFHHDEWTSSAEPDHRARRNLNLMFRQYWVKQRSRIVEAGSPCGDQLSVRGCLPQKNKDAEGVDVVGSARLVVLLCEECGEKVVLGGPESVWRSARTFFECECGQLLTLADREDETRTRSVRLVGRWP